MVHVSRPSHLSRDNTCSLEMLFSLLFTLHFLMACCVGNNYQLASYPGAPLTLHSHSLGTRLTAKPLALNGEVKQRKEVLPALHGLNTTRLFFLKDQIL